MRRFSKSLRTFALGALISVLGGCSEYLDRRDTIALSGGNAVATDVVTHMVDPWRVRAPAATSLSTVRRCKAPSSAIAPIGS